MEKIKVLVCGDVEGRFDTLFSRVNTTCKKAGPFDLLLCVGNFFGVNNVQWSPYKTGEKHVSIPTFVLGPNTEDHNPMFSDLTNGELCENVTYLGKRGLYSITGGLKIVYLSGVEAGEIAKDTSEHTFTKADAVVVQEACLRGQDALQFRGIDILLTSQWPKNVTNLDVNTTVVEDNTSEIVSWLAVQIKPRYHIAGLNGLYYERLPYRNVSQQDDTIELATRFIGLARVGNPEKLKWLYAASLTPVGRMRMIDLCQKTTDETQCPYTSDTKANSQFFYDMNPAVGKKRRGQHEGGPDRKHKPSLDADKCWFCLSSPNVEKHLVISIGESVYLTLAKGGLVPDHLLILPVTHHQATSDIPDNVGSEIEKFKNALREYYSEQEKVPVFFERNYRTFHLQIQVVPIPTQAQVELREIFEDGASGHGYQLEELPKYSRIEQIAPPGTPYFCVELPNGLRLYTRAKKNFPLQFGRDVLASGPILDMEDRIDWRDCIVSKEEETKMATDIRNKFKKFDFTLE